MLKSDLATYPQAHVERPYLANVAHAALALLAAVFAVAPSKSESAAAQPVVSEHERAHTIGELYRLADEFQSTMPSQAAELRAFAGRV